MYVDQCDLYIMDQFLSLITRRLFDREMSNLNIFMPCDTKSDLNIYVGQCDPYRMLCLISP